ncbi:hypothetical protein B0H14DRAFT_2641171 [Mycena olivaceomarginata]|nr:hypothetical protein B0H14DRAFT_2641171 [Mycena olivaceomarginata]
MQLRGLACVIIEIDDKVKIMDNSPLPTAASSASQTSAPCAGFSVPFSGPGKTAGHRQSPRNVSQQYRRDSSCDRPLARRHPTKDVPTAALAQTFQTKKLSKASWKVQNAASTKVAHLAPTHPVTVVFQVHSRNTSASEILMQLSLAVGIGRERMSCQQSLMATFCSCTLISLLPEAPGDGGATGLTLQNPAPGLYNHRTRARYVYKLANHGESESFKPGDNDCISVFGLQSLLTKRIGPKRMCSFPCIGQIDRSLDTKATAGGGSHAKDLETDGGPVAYEDDDSPGRRHRGQLGLFPRR